ncbi:uncharacterized protein J8A68_004477 [[Candida] subhashii]|uniref:Uncharacterized protein n=1 Tax=[Candida] subhashii TaxID=561895 RepID=A0A8J5QFF2_9ASCO|nr:uncharacterized protein J8A68_004477 [[Candida] subhashii]KAG7661977.1 hypothetical protein J8A68_004477 [[Candida] subhashii]
MPIQDSSDTESVDAEVKELISGREELTFGPDVYISQTGSSSNQFRSFGQTPVGVIPPPGIQQQFTGLTKLFDSQGNEYLYHPNGYVTPIRKSNTITTSINNNNNGSGERKPQRRQHRKVSPFIDLSPISSNSPTKLRKYQREVFERIQFLGDLEVSISDRYSVVNNLSQ